MNLSLRNIRRRRALGVYQLGGGCLGIALNLWLLLSLSESKLVLFVIICLLLYSFSIYCGILLLINRESGLACSLIGQCLQLLTFSIGGYAYHFCSGVYMNVGFHLTPFRVEIDAGISSWMVSINSHGVSFIGLNVVAAYLIYYIDQLRKSREEELVINETIQWEQHA